MKNYFYYRFILSVLLSSGVFSVYAASFNCAQAKSATEKLICSNENLSKQDEQLAQIYKNLLGQYKNVTSIRSLQRDWIRNVQQRCDNASCLTKAYSDQINLLSSATAAEEQGRKWTGIYFRHINGKKDPNTSTINIVALKGQRFYVTGVSLWFASKDFPHTGELEGFGKLFGQSLKGETPAELCGAVLQLSSNGDLRVEDESGCGGLNVSFNGEYKKQ